MAPTLEIKRITHKKLPSRIKGPRQVKVGLPASKVSASNLQKAIWNEFGTRGGASGGGWGGPIPERPFMRNSMRSNAPKYKTVLATSAAAILRGEKSTEMVLRQLGLQAQGDIQAEITSGSWVPNSPVTIALKQSSQPLIDTGAMRQSITYEVVR